MVPNLKKEPVRKTSFQVILSYSLVYVILKKPVKPWGPQLSVAATCQDSMLALTNGPPLEETLSLSRCGGSTMFHPSKRGRTEERTVISKVLQFYHALPIQNKHFNNGNSTYFDQRSGAMVLSASKKVRSPIPLDVPKRTSLEPTIVAATNWRCHPEGVLIGFTVGSLGTNITKGPMVWSSNHGKPAHVLAGACTDDYWWSVVSIIPHFPILFGEDPNWHGW